MKLKQQSKQHRTRDIEIKNKLTVTRGEEGGGDNGRKKGKGHQGTRVSTHGQRQWGWRGGLNVGGGGGQGRGEYWGGKWG